MAPTRSSGTGEAGFTLTELLVVLAIMGLLVAMVPVLLQSALPGARSLAAARALAGDLRTMRGAALAGGGATAVQFDMGRQVYLLEPGHARRRLPGGVPFALDRKTQAIGFYADGSSTGGSVLVGDATHRHRVTADWLTGRVSVDE
jgi:general secretion pathway protein H